MHAAHRGGLAVRIRDILDDNVDHILLVRVSPPRQQVHLGEGSTHGMRTVQLKVYLYVPCAPCS